MTGTFCIFRLRLLPRYYGSRPSASLIGAAGLAVALFAFASPADAAMVELFANKRDILPSGQNFELITSASSQRRVIPSGFPDASNTGVPAGVILTPSGGITVTKAGTVIEGLDIKGPVNIQAANVILKNCKITSSGYAPVNIKSGLTGVVVQDCEINGTGSNNDGSHGIAGQGTFLRNNIYNVENGINVQGNNTVIDGNYIHDLNASGAPHYDGVQIDGGVSNVTVTHNTVINNQPGVSAVMVDNYFGAVSNIKIDSNYLAGGGFPLYSDGNFTGSAMTNVSFTNNHIVKGGWGYYYVRDSSPTISGNVESTDGDGP
ncbi:right-handed parallel beta-helix repeat-containing protein [Microvirga terricola]|uniref:Right-handed parallel beta-helix repeat-containing protein n=1 Tax=Microvirga terricola TaxID=2719797 RepID=A0ABX0V9H4_9HYPH|nr:right-handed parallel beta-helix repeat-containing protein [Microvirga terricola]NIX75681.1 right-handed parallel beta-helix repeat-containing protein [Microvirga terricola]